MKLAFAQVFLLALIEPILVTGNDCYNGLGTTPSLDKIMYGRCLDYQYGSQLLEDCDSETAKNCSELLSLFLNSFVSKDPCVLTSANYEDFCNAAAHPITPNTAIFWSGTNVIAHDYSYVTKELSTTLEDSLLGYMANSLNWCGQMESPGINYENCNSSPCRWDASDAFWGTASTTFSSLVEGQIKVMLNGSRSLEDGGAFKNTSFFARYELPNLTDKVTEINIVLIHDLDKPIVETCDDGPTLKELYGLIDARGFPYECEDNPSDITFLLCAINPDSTQCQNLVNFAEQVKPFPTITLLAGIFISFNLKTM